MTIFVVCPSCRAKNRLKDESAGTEVACLGCHERLQVPILPAVVVDTDPKSASVVDRRNEPVNYYAPPVDPADILTCPACGEVIGHDNESCPHCQAVVAEPEEIERGKIPLGVRLLAYLEFLGAALSPFAIVELFYEQEQSRLMTLARMSEILMNGTLSGACGVGYLKGYRWAWWYTMGSSIASIFSVIRDSTIASFYGEELLEGFTIKVVYLICVLKILVDLFFLLYFRRTKVKKYFRVKKTKPMTIVLAGVVVFIGTYVLMELPNDLIGYFEGKRGFFSGNE